MSTKTSIKRIAAVAAVALTLGGFSAVSASATVNADALSVAATTATGVTGTAAKVAFTTSFISDNTADYTQVAAVLISAPATSVALPTVETSTTVTNGTASLPNSSTGKLLTGYTSGGAQYESGTFNVALNASVAGTYVVKLIQSLNSGSSLVTTAPTITFTISAAPSADAASSTSVISAGTSYAPAVADTDDAVLASKTDSQDNSNRAVAVIKVTVKNSAATDLTSATALSVTVAGPGLVATGTSGSLGAFAAAGRAVTGAAGANYITVFSDGTSGVGTITIAAGTTVLATETVTFFGAAASYTTTVTNSVVTTAAAAAAASGSPATPATPAYHAVKVLVKDAAGNPVAGHTVYAVSDDLTVINANYQASTATSDADGYAYFNLVGLKAGTANIKFTNRASATATTPTTEITAPAVAIRVGSSTAASATISFDSSTYTPGAAATVTVTVRDAAGLPVADGVYSVFAAATTSSLALLQGTLPGTLVTGTASGTFVKPTLNDGQVWVKGSTGQATFSVNLPLAAGDVTISGLGASGLAVAQAGLAISATATVGADAAVQAATDAAQEATDAANAAYDAANNAMDSADAATAAAQDAADNAAAALAAVTSLSATVAKLVKSVAAIAAALAKVQKKIGA